MCYHTSAADHFFKFLLGPLMQSLLQESLSGLNSLYAHISKESNVKCRTPSSFSPASSSFSQQFILLAVWWMQNKCNNRALSVPFLFSTSAGLAMNNLKFKELLTEVALLHASYSKSFSNKHGWPVHICVMQQCDRPCHFNMYVKSRTG